MKWKKNMKATDYVVAGCLVAIALTCFAGCSNQTKSAQAQQVQNQQLGKDYAKSILASHNLPIPAALNTPNGASSPKAQ